MKENSKTIGSIMMILGTVIGSGMLALPLASAKTGFSNGVIILLITWFLNTISGYLLIDLNFALPAHASGFNSMYQKFLGKGGNYIAWLGYLMLLYTLIVVAIIGESNILLKFLHQNNVHVLSYQTVAILFTLALGSAVFWSTSMVDYLNRIFFVVKGLALLGSLILVLPAISAKHLFTLPTANYVGSLKYSYLAIPSFMSAFCFQFIIPSLRLYLGDNKKLLKKIILLSTTIALFIYLWWLAAALGIDFSHHTTQSISELNVGELNQLMIKTVNQPIFAFVFNCFANITLTTAFLGASLSLFDFIAEKIKSNDHRARFKTSLLVFLPALVIALFFPTSFITAVNYAALFVLVLCIILPLLMMKKLLKSAEKPETFFSLSKINLLLIINCLIFAINLWCVFHD